MSNLFKQFIVGTLITFSAISLRGQCEGKVIELHSINLGTRSAGDMQIDAQFNKVKRELEDFFSIKVDLYFYEDEKGAQALTLCSSLHPETYSGTVRFGLALLKNELATQNHGEQAAAAILAHEFAHVFQCRVGGSLRHFKRELQADFLAGYFLGRKSHLPGYDIAIFSFAHELFEGGKWFESFHHGTPNERSEALIEGYHNANLSLEEVYLKSLYHYNSYEREDPQAALFATCDLCFGHGKTDRPTKCNICSGDGHYDCNICDGKGSFFFYNKKHQCGACAKTGQQTCSVCEGSGLSYGSKKCPKCNGKKKILKSEVKVIRP